MKAGAKAARRTAERRHEAMKGFAGLDESGTELLGARASNFIQQCRGRETY